jgi:hypothetical protein
MKTIKPKLGSKEFEEEYFPLFKKNTEYKTINKYPEYYDMPVNNSKDEKKLQAYIDKLYSKGVNTGEEETILVLVEKLKIAKEHNQEQLLF